jgi:hypothetical protein
MPANGKWDLIQRLKGKKKQSHLYDCQISGKITSQFLVTLQKSSKSLKCGRKRYLLVFRLFQIDVSTELLRCRMI